MDKNKMVSFSNSRQLSSPLRRRRNIICDMVKTLPTARYIFIVLIASTIVGWRHHALQGIQPTSTSLAVWEDRPTDATTGGETPPTTMIPASTGRRRSKAHFCFSSLHSQIGTRLLLTEFGYSGVNAADGDDWDLIYGGYPYCGTNTTHVLGKENPKVKIDTKDRDWAMERGLNKLLLQKGFDKLQPHQVYYPCMGCSTSYCNKRDLCRILAGINPEWCYVLPDHVDRLTPKMNGTQPWVLKIDAFDIHKHTGSGVSFISTPDELPSMSKQSTRLNYLVQPWNEPFLGKGPWRRKSEVRFTVALTSVYPLRAYVYGKPYMIIAAKRYTNSQEAMVDKCMVDTHSSTKKCAVQDEDQNFVNLVYENRLCHRCLDFGFYAEQVGMSKAQSSQFLEDAHALIAQVLKAGHPILENNVINTGINASGASCFSQMRVDVGITADLKPFIFEFPEFHNMREEFGINVHETRDLFKMVGVDAPPLLPDQRADYELAHRGEFILLDTTT